MKTDPTRQPISVSLTGLPSKELMEIGKQLKMTAHKPKLRLISALGRCHRRKSKPGNASGKRSLPKPKARPNMTSAMLEAALSYIAQSFPVIPLCWPTTEGKCACRKNHELKNAGKAPITNRGLNDATQTRLGVKEYLAKMAKSKYWSSDTSWVFCH